ncbi:hypothetical protein ACQP2K_25365 [Microbispora siamensis]
MIKRVLHEVLDASALGARSYPPGRTPTSWLRCPAAKKYSRER